MGVYPHPLCMKYNLGTKVTQIASRFPCPLSLRQQGPAGLLCCFEALCWWECLMLIPLCYTRVMVCLFDECLQFPRKNTLLLSSVTLSPFPPTSFTLGKANMGQGRTFLVSRRRAEFEPVPGKSLLCLWQGKQSTYTLSSTSSPAQSLGPSLALIQDQLPL